MRFCPRYSMYHPNYSHLCKTAGETVGGRSAFAARFFYRLATNQAAETRGPPSGGVAWTTKRRRCADHRATEASSSFGPCEARRAQQQLEEVVLPLLAPAGLEIKGGAGVENCGQWWPDQRYVQRRFFWIYLNLTMTNNLSETWTATK